MITSAFCGFHCQVRLCPDSLSTIANDALKLSAVKQEAPTELVGDDLAFASPSSESPMRYAKKFCGYVCIYESRLLQCLHKFLRA